MSETATVDRVADWPSVTVVVPTRDRPDRLREAVRSISLQDYPGRIECVVVFDRSEPLEIEPPDATHRAMRVIVNSRTPGPAGARNSGALEASGALLAFCDDDDEWHPQKLRLQVDALRSARDIGAVTCGVTVVYGQRSVHRIPPRDRILLHELIRSRSAEVHTSTILVDVDAYRERIGLLDESMPAGYGEDYEWLLRAAAWRPIWVVRRPLVRVHWHDASWFDGRWDTIIAAIERLIEKHPEIAEDRAGLSRLYGRIAFAHAAAGRRRQAWRWIDRTFRLDPRERRTYIAAFIALGLVSPQRVLDLAHRAGKGI